MANVNAVKGLEELVARFRAKAATSIKDTNFSVVVGNTASYAIFVHEDLQAHHFVGQAKFLEQPFREYAGEMTEIVRKALRAGRTLPQAVLLAGLKLQREAQLLTPVDTSMLKNSFFTRIESGTAAEGHGPVRPIEG